MSKRRFRPVAAVMLVLHLVGCVTMQPVSQPVASYLATEAPSRVQVRTVREEEITLADPRIEQDSIFGEIVDGRRRPSGVQWRSPLSDVTEIRVPRTDGGRTAVMVVLVLPWALLALVVAACSNDGCN